MRRFPLILLVCLIASSAIAQHLGRTAPPKFERAARSTHNQPVQGGDTFGDAYPVSALPFTHTGTTAGYTNDYDEVCYSGGSTAPDVVYKMQFPTDALISIDMCGSAYDTKIYVYGAGMNLVACNDDFYFDDVCGVYVSKIENMPIEAGVKYFLVIDGYGDSAGDYALLVEEFVPSVVECPDWSVIEGEPPLMDGYLDSFNGGCNSPEFGNPFQVIGYYEERFCGVSGWYDGTSRDTDWLVIFMGFENEIEITIDAEQASYLFELLPHDCANVAVVQNVIGGPCSPAEMSITGYAATAPVWIWVGPTIYDGPQGEYDYVLWFSGILLAGAPQATEHVNWGAVKSLYR